MVRALAFARARTPSILSRKRQQSPEIVVSSIEPDDEQLMLEYAGGNTQAFKRLYARYENVLYRYAYNSCSNEASAQEVFQEAWLRVVKARNTFCATQPFKPWLFSITRNLLTDHYRRQSTSALDNRADIELSSDPEFAMHDTPGNTALVWNNNALSPEQIAAATQQGETLQSALQCLPLAQREAVMLKHIAGFTLNEIAQIQGQGAQATKSRLRYAMIKLRQQLVEPS